MSSESSLPSDILEHRAEEERRRLHDSVRELKSSVRETVREHLDAKRYLREYMRPALIVVTVMGLLSGYSTAGMFTRR